jgi:hypothetical protein
VASSIGSTLRLDLSHHHNHRAMIVVVRRRSTIPIVAMLRHVFGEVNNCCHLYGFYTTTNQIDGSDMLKSEEHVTQRL